MCIRDSDNNIPIGSESNMAQKYPCIFNQAECNVFDINLSSENNGLNALNVLSGLGNNAVSYTHLYSNRGHVF